MRRPKKVAKSDFFITRLIVKDAQNKFKITFQKPANTGSSLTG